MEMLGDSVKELSKLQERKCVSMAVSYKRLWKLLIDKDLKKKDLVELVGISQYTVNKMNRGDNVNTETLEKICRALNCTFDEIIEVSDKL